MAYQTFILTGAYPKFNGVPSSGTIEVIPSEDVVLDATGKKILSGRVKVTLEEDGTFDVALPDPNDTSLNPAGFGYTVVAKLHHTHLPRVSFGPDQIVGGAVDVADVTPVDPSTFDPVATYAPSSTVTALDARVTTLETTPTVTSYLELTDKPTIPATAEDVGALPAAETDTTVAALAQDPASATGAALLATYARVSGRPYNVLNTGHPLRDAIGDGGPHPLSERFGSLTAAQEQFPRANALTEQIDRHALQYALDNYDHVIVPGQGNYLIDSTLYTSGADTPRGLGNQTFEMLDGPGELLLSDGTVGGEFPEKLYIFASGNVRTTTNYSNSNSTDSPPCNNLTLKVRINGNNQTLSAAGYAGLYTVNCSNLDLDAIVHNVGGAGIRLYGVNDAYTRNVLLRRVWAYDNGKNGTADEKGLAVSLRHRNVTYLDVKCWGNMSDGVFIDHSEANTVSVMAWENDGCGIEAHNFSRNNMRGLWAQGNGEHGILISGAWDSLGSNWVSTGNGQISGGVSGGGWADVKLDNRDGSYGITRDCRFTNIVAGYYEGGTGDTTLINGCDYALSVDDLVTGANEIEGLKIAGAGLLGDVDFPADFGELSIKGTRKGTTVPTTWVGPERYIVKAADQTVNNSTTLVADTDLTFPVGAGQTWVIDYTLKQMGSNTTADMKYNIAAPAGSSGGTYLIQGAVSTATGGVGGFPGYAPLGIDQRLATFASTNTVAMRAVITTTTAGDITLQWAQDVADPSDLKVGAGSILCARRVA